MLDFLLWLALGCMFAATVLGIFLFDSKFLKCACITAVILLSLSFFVSLQIYDRAVSEAEISNIEISEIYKNGENEYFVKLNDSDILSKVKVSEVFKGDNNYLIRTHLPNMSKTREFLFEQEKTEYFLVVTDLNIPVLSTID